MNARILVVEDHPTLRATLADLLRDEGFAVRTAEDGLEALLRLQRESVDLVLADVAMPHVDGADLIDELRDRGDRTPVLLMSVDRRPACSRPGVDFIAKPFDLDDLLRAVTCQLDGGPLGDALPTIRLSPAEPEAHA